MHLLWIGLLKDDEGMFEVLKDSPQTRPPRLARMAGVGRRVRRVDFFF
jgi:hypothetical protein